MSSQCLVVRIVEMCLWQEAAGVITPRANRLASAMQFFHLAVCSSLQLCLLVGVCSQVPHIHSILYRVLMGSIASAQ